MEVRLHSVFKGPLLQNGEPFRTKTLFKYRCLAAVTPHGNRNSEESIIPSFEFWSRHVKTENRGIGVQRKSVCYLSKL